MASLLRRSRINYPAALHALAVISGAIPSIDFSLNILQHVSLLPSYEDSENRGVEVHIDVMFMENMPAFKRQFLIEYRKWGGNPTDFVEGSELIEMGLVENTTPEATNA